MKYLLQFLLILFISLVGEILNTYIPLPIPASIYGMVILFTLLVTKVIKLEHVKDTGKFLIDIMPIMFIPAGVGLLDSYGVLEPILVPAIIITFITSIVVMVATGWTSQLIIRLERRKHHE